jgi:hypothetical protein
VQVPPTPYQIFQLLSFKRYGKLPPERFLFVPTGVYIKLKNDLLLSKLKNLVLSLMALQAEMRGKEKETMGDAIASVRKTMELLK